MEPSFFFLLVFFAEYLRTGWFADAFGEQLAINFGASSASKTLFCPFLGVPDLHFFPLVYKPFL